MKKQHSFFMLTMLALLALSCLTVHAEVVTRVKGKVVSGNASEVLLRWMVDNPITGKGETYRAAIGSDGAFSMDVPLERMATGRVYVGTFMHEFCLMPGDDLFVRVDGDSMVYQGKGAATNTFLYQAERAGLWNTSFYKEVNRGELSLTEFMDWMLAFKQRRWAFLEAYTETVPLPKEFVAWYRADTEANFENMMHQYIRVYAGRKRISQDSLEIPSDYQSLIEFGKGLDDARVVSSNYVHNLRNRLYDKAAEVQAGRPGLKMKEAFLEVIRDTLQGKTREAVLTKSILSSFSQNQYDSASVKLFKTLDVSDLAQSTFQAGLAKYEEKQALIGQPLHPEFANTLLLDTAGREWTLAELIASFKGKKVYLDFWGMGCGPCRMEMPYAKQLKEKVAGEPVVFVYVSMEAVKSGSWGKVFEATHTNEHHFVMKNGFDSRLNQFMEINWVPCYMMVDAQGALLDFNAPRPSALLRMERPFR